MTIIERLRALAGKATPELDLLVPALASIKTSSKHYPISMAPASWRRVAAEIKTLTDLYAALSPEVVEALLDVCGAAKNVRDATRGSDTLDSDNEALDSALSRLSKLEEK